MRNKDFARFKGRDINYNFGEWDIFDGDKDYLDFMKKWLDELPRILKPNANVVIFLARKYRSVIGNYLEYKHNIRWRNELIWVKTNPVPHLRKVQFASGTEHAIWLSNGKNTFNYKEGHSPNYFISSICMGKERTEHPTQKSISLIQWILKYLSNEGDLVLDPFMGSGTTAVASKILNRNFIGFEISEEYVKIANERLKPYREQTKLNEILP